jgi:hypothetical protein
LYKGRLFIKNQDYSSNNWRAIFKATLEFSIAFKASPLKFIYLENCQIPEEAFVYLLKHIKKCPDLEEIILVKIQLGIETVKAINHYSINMNEAGA